MRNKSENLLFEKALRLEPLTASEGLMLFSDASTPDLIWVAG
jgi:hypothetical protein